MNKLGFRTKFSQEELPVLETCYSKIAQAKINLELFSDEKIYLKIVHISQLEKSPIQKLFIFSKSKISASPPLFPDWHILQLTCP